MRTLPPIAAILFFLALAAPAEACWPWCRKGAPSGSIQTVELAAPVSSTSPTVALQIASTSPAITMRSPSTSTAINTMERWGISDAAARGVFNMAYENTEFQIGRSEAYGLWLQSIGDVDEYGYKFGRPGNSIRATGSRQTGVWQVDMDWSIASTAAIEWGQQLRTERDTYRGLFARALVALGGPAAIHRIIGLYVTGDARMRQLADAQHADRLNVAARLDLGILTRDFLYFSPLHVHEVVLDARYEVYFGRQIVYPPIPDEDPSITPFEPALQTGIRGFDDQPVGNLGAQITSTIGLEDSESSIHDREEKEELLGDTEKGASRGSTEKNPLLD